MHEAFGLIRLQPHAIRDSRRVAFGDELALVARKPKLAAHFTTNTPHEHGGFRHVLYRHDYRSGLFYNHFCGGPEAYSNWITRDDLIGALGHLGMDVVYLRDDPEHGNGPALSLVAVRRERPAANY